jgi:hypothetical protein
MRRKFNEDLRIRQTEDSNKFEIYDYKTGELYGYNCGFIGACHAMMWNNMSPKAQQEWNRRME